MKFNTTQKLCSSAALFLLIVMPASPLLATTARSTYSGLFSPTNDLSTGNSGGLTITTTGKGGFSGKIQMGTSRYSFKGSLNGQGEATVSVKRGKLATLSLQFHTNASAGDQLFGSLGDGAWTAQLVAEKNPFDGKSKVSPQAGRYTMVIPGKESASAEPSGAGYATISVSKAGRAKVIAVLADGTKVTQSGSLSVEGALPFYAGLYRGQGSLGGWLNVSSEFGGKTGGMLNWNRPAAATGKYYASGFTNQPVARVSFYEPPPKGNAILSFSDGDVLLDGGNLNGLIQNTVHLDSNNHVKSTGSNKVSLAFTLSTGAFKGKALDPATAKPINFAGVVLQSCGQGFGSFNGSTLIGNARLVSIQPDIIQFQIGGNNVTGDVHYASTPGLFRWDWSDSTSSQDYPVASHSFAGPSDATQTLTAFPSGLIESINFGFDASDGGENTPLTSMPPQNLTSVSFPAPLTGLRYWASSYNPITNTLDFSGFNSLERIECFRCTSLEHVSVDHLPGLKRLCLEACPLNELNISGNPNLEDLRAAVSAYTNIVVGESTGPKVWHFCTRANPQLQQNLSDILTNFYSLQELWIWNDSQSGTLKPVSTNLTDVEFNDNYYEVADFSNQTNLQICLAYNNSLTNLVLTGCNSLQTLDAQNNNFTTEGMDKLLLTLESLPSLQFANLGNNPALPSAAGYASYNNLIDRGVVVYVDQPPP
jgi:hypothetical protein